MSKGGRRIKRYCCCFDQCADLYSDYEVFVFMPFVTHTHTCFFVLTEKKRELLLKNSLLCFWSCTQHLKAHTVQEKSAKSLTFQGLTQLPRVLLSLPKVHSTSFALGIFLDFLPQFLSMVPNEWCLMKINIVMTQVGSLGGSSSIDWWTLWESTLGKLIFFGKIGHQLKPKLLLLP